MAFLGGNRAFTASTKHKVRGYIVGQRIQIMQQDRLKSTDSDWGIGDEMVCRVDVTDQDGWLSMACP